jgi:hypothetical protein
MKAIGFSNETEIVDNNNNAKSKTHLVLTLNGLTSKTKLKNLPNSIIKTLESKRFEIDQETIALEGSPSVASAVREMLQNNSVISEVRDGLETALSIVSNILLQPSNIKLHRIKKGNPIFHRNLGHLERSVLLMNSIGFTDISSKAMNDAENIMTVYILKSFGTAEVAMNDQEDSRSKFFLKKIHCLKYDFI